MQIPKNVMEKMEKAASREAQRRVGMSIAKETLQSARKMDRIAGAYIFPPFGNYEAVSELLK
jgi:hypothetical protein